MSPIESSRPADCAPRRGAVAVIVESSRLLVIRRAAGISAGGKICFPGGGIEAGESEDAAVVRELGEELNLRVRPIRRLWECVTPWNVHLAWWLTRRLDDEAPRPHPEEVAEYFWLSVDELESHVDLLPSNLAFLTALARGEITLV